MKPFILFFALLFIGLLSFQSCKKNKKDTSVWTYSGSGDGNIESSQKATVSVTIKNSLIVNGKAQLQTGATIKNDLNINGKGRVVVLATNSTDTVYVDGNANINDTLLVQKGILKVSHDFNINASGVVNCSNDAQIVVVSNLNQAGTLWGNTNVKAAAKHINNPQQTYPNPLPYYSTGSHY